MTSLTACSYQTLPASRREVLVQCEKSMLNKSIDKTSITKNASSALCRDELSSCITLSFAGKKCMRSRFNMTLSNFMNP